MANTIIKITPQGTTAQQTVKIYESCQVTLSSTDSVGKFELVLPRTDSDIVDLFTFNSDVQITQDGNVFRGIVLDSGKSLNRNIRTVTITGADYAAKTQKILVTESYTSQTISYIVDDLMANHASFATRNNIETCSPVLTISFPDKFLWDCMEQLCAISGYQWYIDENLDVHFFQPTMRINSNTIITGNFWAGSASLKPDAGKMVNRLTVKGGKALSDPFNENFTITNTVPIPLKYTPRATTAGVTVILGTASQTVGIQNITPAGTKDFLLNFSEKLIVPDQAVTGSYTITYKYEYPLKILVEEPTSIADYGYWDDVLAVVTDDQTTATVLGLAHLTKYSQPLISGSVAPFNNIYKPGEVVLVNIPELGITEHLQIKEVVYFSEARAPRVERTLQLESISRNLSGVLKDINNRLGRLEKDIYATDEGLVLRYIASSEGWDWAENVTETVNACPVPSVNLYPSDTLYSC